VVRKDSFKELDLDAPEYLRTGLAFAKREIARSRGPAGQCHSEGLDLGVSDNLLSGYRCDMYVASFYAYVGMNISSRRRKGIGDIIVDGCQPAFVPLTVLKIERCA
jgi:hypothetical protein